MQTWVHVPAQFPAAQLRKIGGFHHAKLAAQAEEKPPQHDE